MLTDFRPGRARNLPRWAITRARGTQRGMLRAIGLPSRAAETATLLHQSADESYAAIPFRCAIRMIIAHLNRVRGCRPLIKVKRARDRPLDCPSLWCSTPTTAPQYHALMGLEHPFIDSGRRAALGGRPAEAMCRAALHILRPRYSGKSLTASPSAVCMAVKQVASAPVPTSMGQGAPQR